MTATIERRPESCPTCFAARPSTAYCAPRRCYCGHEDCPAFASYIDLSVVPLPPIPEPRKDPPKRKGRRR